MNDPTLKRIEKVVLQGHAFGHNRTQVIARLKSMGITKQDMDKYTAYVKEHNHDTTNTTN